MKNKTFKVNDKVIVFDQPGVITKVLNETSTPYIYDVKFDNTNKTYPVENYHIKFAGDITERIKTIEDACNELGEHHPFVRMYNEGNNSCIAGMNGNLKDVMAYFALRIIVAALNEGWTPKFVPGERRWYPWFVLLTQEEIEDMDEENRRVVGRANNFAYANGGLVCSYASYASSGSGTSNGSRLAFRTEELAEYAGRQFAQIFADFIFA